MAQPITRSISIAANDEDSNVLRTLGLRIQTLDAGLGPQAIQIGWTGSATGLTASFFVEAKNPIETSLVNVQDRVPVLPDDFVTVEPILARAGAQLQLKVTNSTGGALTFFFTIVTSSI